MTKKLHFEDLLGSRARAKILKVLALNEELTISLIINKTRLNYNNAVKHLEYLRENDFVQEKRFGRIKIFRYNIENKIARSLKDFIILIESKEKD